MAMRPTPRIQFRPRITSGADIAVGPGKIELLEAIAKTGSITAAARTAHHARCSAACAGSASWCWA